MAFVRGEEFSAQPIAKVGVIQREGVGMIVVDDDHDVGLDLGQPFLGRLVALEDGLPIGLVGLSGHERVR